MIFEFGTFNKSTFPTPGDFLAALDPFLAALPEGFRYAVEVRNPEYLIPDYLDLLASRNVAHVFNAWTRMPVLEDQVKLPDAFTADFTVMRALLKEGRPYEQAVKTFEPYRSIREPNEGAREGMRRIAEESRRRKQPAFLAGGQCSRHDRGGGGPARLKAVPRSLAAHSRMTGCKLIGSQDDGVRDKDQADHVENEGQRRNGQMARMASWITWKLHRVIVDNLKTRADPPDHS